MTDKFLSWGRLQHTGGALLPPPEGRDSPLPVPPFLPVGLGRSYGDVCLNSNGRLLPMTSLKEILDADWDSGRIRIETGLSLGELIEHCLPHGWFPPVLPGTRHVTIGGAIANDVHGKNHHQAGTFGHHISRLWLRRSDREAVIECSPQLEPALFRATIGGLGLTGVIVSAELELMPVKHAWMEVEFCPFTTLDSFASLTESSDADWAYTVAWVDLQRATTAHLPGIFMRGNHAESIPEKFRHRPPRALFRWPFELPVNPFNRLSVGAFNQVYYNRQKLRKGRFLQHFGGFFHPLDVVDDWNKLYGPRGFYQYQCVIPSSAGLKPFRELFACLRESRATVPLAVMKQTGSMEPAGLLSFPMPGWTLAMDLPNRGAKTLELFKRLDAIVQSAGGRLYSAKDATMSAEFFQAAYPQWTEVEQLRDPGIESDFWKRVTAPIS